MKKPAAFSKELQKKGGLAGTRYLHHIRFAASAHNHLTLPLSWYFSPFWRQRRHA
jgi:hypothetical protein